jgi:hypothetical protein
MSTTRISSGGRSHAARTIRAAISRPYQSSALIVIILQPQSLTKSNLFPGGDMDAVCRSAPLSMKICEAAARDALQRQLETSDRGIGRWRGTGLTIRNADG